MLLITKGRFKNGRNYPTMSLIIRGLFSNVRLALYYFQLDSLWESRSIESNNHRTDDVYGQKGVSVKIRKTGPLFSMGYRQQNGESPGAKATMCMSDKSLGSRQHSPAILYLSENKARRSLAVKITASEPTMCMKQKGLS
jgi:hypothetical protein